MQTLPRILHTPTIQHRDVTIHQPLIGSIVAIECNGYGSGMKQSYVVTWISKTHAGITTRATLRPINQITDTEVTFNTESPAIGIKPYFNKKYAVGWHYEAAARISYLIWDRYTPTDMGYMK